MKNYSIIIETNKYAGNFEREMCAFITGEIGECEVGSDSRNSDFDYSIFQGVLEQKPDDHGCWRPVNLYSYNGKPYGVQIHFEEIPTKQQFDTIRERAPLFDSEIKINDVYTIEDEVITTTTKIPNFQLIN